MAEIKIAIDALENKISELQTLQNEISTNATTPPATVGGGTSVNELEKIATLHQTMLSSIQLLVTNTISFMENIKVSYVESDGKASKKIAG